MLIDFHVHLADTVPIPRGQRLEVSAAQLIDRMNREGIDRTILLPLESPEAIQGYYTTRAALNDWALYPERLIPFVSIDPRMPDPPGLIAFYEEEGCRGFGELKNGLPFDHPLNQVIFAECDRRGWPLVFHMDPGLCEDEVGLPRLEACLRRYPDCRFCGHGPGFWSAICARDDRQGGYPTGPITPGGALDRLMDQYPNLYGEISAGSGHNALTRDPDFTAGFLQRHADRLLFGTDFMYAGQELPQVAWIRSEALTDDQRAAIGSGNALRLLRRTA